MSNTDQPSVTSATAGTTAAITVDARRLLCPIPVIRTQEQLDKLDDGVTVEVICTDPGALHDVPAWARIHGHTVLGTRSDDNEHIITLRTGVGTSTSTSTSTNTTTADTDMK